MKRSRALALITVCTMLISCLSGCANAYAAEPEAETTPSDTLSSLENTAVELLKSHGSEQGKEEMVYVLADADGKVQEEIVSCWLKNPEEKATISDSSSLKHITNIKGDESFSAAGEKLTWDAEGNDIWYQGQTEKQLPITVNISYTLDGKKVSAEELAGASGHLTVDFDYTNNVKADRLVNGKTVTMYQPFLVISGLALDNTKAQNVEVTNGTVINSGDMSIVIGTAMPGLSESLGLDELNNADGKPLDLEIPDKVTIDADISSFSLAATVTVYDNSALSMLDLDNAHTIDDLQDAINRLTSATSQLVDGSTELTDGISTLKDGTSALKDGAGTLSTGLNEYLAGTESLNNGIHTLSNGLPALLSGVDALYNGSKSASAGAKQILSGYDSDNGVLAGGAALISGATELDTAVNNNPVTLDKETKDTISGTAASGVTAYSGQIAQSVVKGISENISSGEKQAAQTGAAGAANQSAAFASGVLNGVAANISSSANTVGEQGGQGAANLAGSFASGVCSTISGNISAGAEKAKSEGAAAAESYSGAIASGACQSISASVSASKGAVAGQITANGDLVALVAAGLAASNAYTDENGNIIYPDASAFYGTAEAIVLQYGQGVAGGVVDSVAGIISGGDTVSAVSASLNDSLAALGSGIAENVISSVAASVGDGSTVSAVSEGLSGGLYTMGSKIASDTANGIAQNVVSENSVSTVSAGLSGSLSELGGAIASQTVQSVAAAVGSDDTVNTVSAGLNPALSTIGSTVASQTADAVVDGINSALPSTLGVYTGMISDGLKALYDGLHQLYNGTYELSDGIDAVNNGLGTLSNSSAEVSDGVNQLVNGSETLVSNNETISSGADMLSQGSVTLDNGAQQLLDGAKALSEGMQQFSQEGIAKLSSLMEDDLQSVFDRLRALQEYSREYTSFSGSGYDDPSSVRFIVRTESIGE